MLLLADNPKPRIFAGRSLMHGPSVWMFSVQWGLRVVCEPWTCNPYRRGLMVAVDLDAFRRASYALRRAFFAGVR